MASKLLNVLDEVERGRQNCIRALRLKDIDARKNSSFDEIAADIAYVHESNNPIGMTEWVRPEEWPDTRSITEAEEIIQDEAGYWWYPVMTLLLRVDNAYTEINNFLSSSATYTGFRTSGGHVVLGATTYTIQQDDILNIGLHYEVMWVTLYYRGSKTYNTDPRSFSSFQTRGAFDSYILEVMLNYFSWSGYQTWMYLGGNYLCNVDYIDSHAGTWANYTCGYAANAYHVRLPVKVLWPDTRDINGWNNNSTKIQVVEFPNLESFRAGNSWAYGFLTQCPNLVKAYFPKLKQFTGYFLGGCPKLREVDLPNLEELTFNYDSNQPSRYCLPFSWAGCYIYLPKVHTWHGHLRFMGVSNSYAALGNIALPSLELVEGDVNLQQISEYLPSLHTVEGTLYLNTNEHAYVNLPELTYANAISVSGDHFVDDMDAFLEWVPSMTDGHTHTFTISGTPASQFTEDIKDQIREKGWTVS